MSFLQPLVVFIAALSILVLVHEWGHYYVARRSGVRVLRFSIGFGPEVLGITRGETRWSICAIPFGGYVKFAGDNPEEERDDVSVSAKHFPFSNKCNASMNQDMHPNACMAARAVVYAIQ